MPESFASRRLRWGFNLFPAYRGTGARMTYIAGDYREVRVRLPLSWRTRNYVGTIFGGSLYGAVDPVYMIMLIKILGPGYTVWDKAATIRFRRPGRSTLYARFVLDEEEIRAIRELAEKSPVDRPRLSSRPRGPGGRRPRERREDGVHTQERRSRRRALTSPQEPFSPLGSAVQALQTPPPTLDRPDEPAEESPAQD